jgi:hypothetical protein
MRTACPPRSYFAADMETTMTLRSTLRESTMFLVVMALAGSSAVAGGCGGEVTGKPGGATDSSSPAPRVPLNHRPEDTACTSPRAASCPTAVDAGLCGLGGSCSIDSDCTAGSNGRCTARLPFPLECTYDECLDDTGCGQGVPCVCRTSASDTTPNTCLTGSSCTVDGDCGPGGYCSPSTDCGTSTYHCHTRSDTCIDDVDCAASSATPVCLFDESAARWQCTAQPSCPHSK